MTDHLHDAAETIAKAVKANADPHAGWLKYAPAGDAAVLALIEAGWTPPGDGFETDRLRQTVLNEQDLARQAWEHLARAQADLDAAGAFRARFLGLFFELQQQLTDASEAARIAGESEPTYQREQILKWLTRNLDLSDRAADRTKAKSLAVKQDEKSTTLPAAS